MLDWSLFLECDCIRNVVLPLVVCYFTIRFCWFLWTQVKTFVIYASKPAFDFVAAADGGFALITGGAGGIGRSCAIEFAKIGINLFLVDYSADLLSKTVADLKKINPEIKIKSKIMDLTKLMTDKSTFEEFKKELDSEKIGILFNNAGIAETKLFNYSESSYEEITNLVKINIGVPALLDRIVLPQMLKRKNGLIMNMGSASAKTPVGLLPLYGSSKSFMIQLSQSLQDAYPSHESGITFHVFHPQFIRTPMTKVLDEDWKEPNKLSEAIKNKLFPVVEEWVPSALKMVGRYETSCGWYFHEFAVWMQPATQFLGALKWGFSRDAVRKAMKEKRLRMEKYSKKKQ